MSRRRRALREAATGYSARITDRVNVGFATLSMSRDLGLTATTFGIANTILFTMYTVFEVPSSLMLMRFGIRPLSTGDVTRIMPLAFLAPDIVQAIYEGAAA